MRIAADYHYFSDVLTGALLGAVFGVLIPATQYNRYFGSHDRDPMNKPFPPPTLQLTGVF
jgi:hypothetical protein